MAYLNGKKVLFPVQVYSGGDSMHTYSTDEQVVGTWIDGTPLYEKTIIVTEFHFTRTFTDYAHNIDNVRFGFVAEAIALRNSVPPQSDTDDYSKNILGKYIYSLTDDDNNFRDMVWGMDATNVRFRHSGSSIPATSNHYDAYITIRYTKTTDTATE